MNLRRKIFHLKPTEYEDPVLEIHAGVEDNVILKTTLWHFVWKNWYHLHHVKITNPERVRVYLNGEQIKRPEGVFEK